MKTTIELTDELFRLAKATAASQGRSLRDFFTEALEEKLAQSKSEAGDLFPPWMKYFGTFENSPDETLRIQEAVDREFGQIDPLEAPESEA
jgi:hypothetical protein